MVQFKALMLVSLVIMTLNSCNGQQKNRSSEAENKIIIKNTMVNSDTILILKSQYKILTHNMGALDIEITDSTLADRISNTKNPVFKIELEGNYTFAKGNNIFSSSVPKECDYFYPLDNDNKVVISDNQIINLRKIDKDIE